MRRKKGHELRLHIVGAGNPVPRKGCFGSAFLLQVDDENILVDCGPATTYKLLQTGVDTTQIAHLFFTHHHSDHNADYPCFALTRWDLSTDETPPLNVYGPPPTEEFHEKLLGEQGAYSPDLTARINHPISQYVYQSRGGRLPRPALRSRVKNIGPGVVKETETWKVSAEKVDHIGPYLENLAYRFDIGDFSIVFAGDCANCEGLLKIARDTDVLVMACTYFEEDSPYRTCIPGTHDVIDVVNRTNAGKVILTHTNARFSRPGIKEQAVSQIARGCAGEVLMPREVECLELSLPI